MKWKYRKKKEPKQHRTLLAEGMRMEDIIIVATEMLSRGSSVEDIIKITGLSEEEIIELIKK